MPCIAMYQVELETGNMILLAGGSNIGEEIWQYDEWYNLNIRPLLLENRQQAELSDLCKASSEGRDIYIRFQSKKTGRWLELTAMAEAEARNTVIMVKDIHHWLICERKKNRMSVFRYFRNRVEELRNKGFYCGCLVLDLDRQCLIRFAESEVMEYFKSDRFYMMNPVYAQIRQKFLSGDYEEEAQKGVIECLDINISQTEDNHWISLYGKTIITERGRHYKFLMFLDRYTKKEAAGSDERKDYLEERAEGYLFEWNIEDNTMVFSDGWDTKFKLSDDKAHRSGRKRMENYVIKEDRARIKKFYNSILADENQDNMLLRFCLNEDENQYAWCSVGLLSVLYNGKIPMYVIGSIRDVSSKLKNLFETTLGKDGSSVEKKALCGRQYVEDILNNRETEVVHAVFVIHIDKIIPDNDTAGLGIFVYQYMEILSAMIYSQDRIWMEAGNVILFLNKIGSRENARSRANRIVKMMDCLSGQTSLTDIGMALYPEDGTKLEELILLAGEDLWNGKRFDHGMKDLGNIGGSGGIETNISLITDIVEEWHRMMRVNSLIEKKMKMTEAELRLSQIQPHFIYNVLANIKSLIYTDPDRAESIIVAFTKLLRVQLDAIGKDNVAPFDEILSLVESYIKIEQSRFPERFQVHYDIQYSNFSMPHLILQPLVENAIKHGFSKCSKVGNIMISSRLEDEMIIIQVEDDGAGYRCTLDSCEESSKRHVGIENVRSRISYLMRGNLEISGRQEGGTVITITIPGAYKGGFGFVN